MQIVINLFMYTSIMSVVLFTIGQTPVDGVWLLDVIIVQGCVHYTVHSYSCPMHFCEQQNNSIPYATVNSMRTHD